MEQKKIAIVYPLPRANEVDSHGDMFSPAAVEGMKQQIKNLMGEGVKIEEGYIDEKGTFVEAERRNFIKKQLSSLNIGICASFGIGHSIATQLIEKQLEHGLNIQMSRNVERPNYIIGADFGNGLDESIISVFRKTGNSFEYLNNSLKFSGREDEILTSKKLLPWGEENSLYHIQESIKFQKEIEGMMKATQTFARLKKNRKRKKK